MEFRTGGRRVSQRAFFENIERQVLDVALTALEERARGAAASVVDPETGKHADVFVERSGDAGLIMRTSGSAAFARELERRLGVEQGSVDVSERGTANQTTPSVYLAHASEDHEALARPLANKLLAAGIDVWLDDWEIHAGDSLRRKMEEGLAGCTHFVVILSPNSLAKNWVQAEIDAGFVIAVGGSARFIGLRAGLSLDRLSPFLRSLRCPELDLTNEYDTARLISDIHGISRKPAVGASPKYVKTVPPSLSSWSQSAVAIADYMVRASEHGIEMDPQLDVEAVVQATGMPEDDVRLGLLDLIEAGLVKATGAAGDDFYMFWPKPGLFVEFDKHFLGFDTKADAVAVATWAVNSKADGVDMSDLASNFPGWEPRRVNSALNYLDRANLVHALKGGDSRPWALVCFMVNDRTRRFVRENS